MNVSLKLNVQLVRVTLLTRDWISKKRNKFRLVCSVNSGWFVWTFLLPMRLWYMTAFKSFSEKNSTKSGFNTNKASILEKCSCTFSLRLWKLLNSPCQFSCEMQANISKGTFQSQSLRNAIFYSVFAHFQVEFAIFAEKKAYKLNCSCLDMEN